MAEKTLEIEIYALDPSAGTFTRLDTIKTYQNLSFGDKLNGIGVCSFDLNIFDQKANAGNLIRFRNHVIVKRNGTIVWSGCIGKVTGNLDSSDGAGSVTIQCFDPLFHLKTRYTTSTYRATDAGSIAWQLIDATQSETNGSLGITQGTIQTTVNRDRSYENVLISDAIVNLSSVINGFDFIFVPQVDADGLFIGWTFNVLLSLSTDRTTQYTIKESDIDSLTFSSDSDLYNTVSAYGTGTGSSRLTAEDEDTTFQETYTRREAILVASDVFIQETLDEKVAFELRDNKTEVYNLQLTIKQSSVIQFGNIGIGDIIDYDLQSGFATFAGTARVTALEVTIDSVGAEWLKPILSLIP